MMLKLMPGFLTARLSQPKFIGSIIKYPIRSLGIVGQRRRGIHPALVHWWSGLRQCWYMWKLHRLLGREFDEYEFLEGVRQAVTLMIEAVRQADWSRIRSCCTDQGACAIYGLTQSQRKTQYTQLLRFERQHLCHVAPISVQRLCDNGRHYIYADMLIVGLRDMRDFDNSSEQLAMWQQLNQICQQSRIPKQLAPTHRSCVIGEFQMTLRKELSECPENAQGWLIDFYKVHGFKLVNYSPVTLQYRIIEFLKPV